MQTVNIVYGTVYGAAQFTAETINTAIADLGYTARLLHPVDLASFTPPQDELLIIVSSTTGQGDVPDDILPWFSQLQSQAPYSPKLRFSIVGLGDSSYENFCGAADQLEELFIELGAQALTETLKIDACETMEPEQEASQWISVWHGAAQSLDAA
ncbi:flavodoxin [Shewanella sp. WXL01]|uniref:flavodoxin n=1 Tax=Shewanella sp. WXL01 TaxID=2709721 RepID=UPI00143856A8|nr:flavodoxin [Shewanella sp. WXL01]NKF50235.1 flavodoxin [Shewanella sp. WXL01]